MEKSSKKLTFTVGITTCYGENSILDTVRSIRGSKGVGNFPFIIIADNVPINPWLKKNLKKYNVKLIENKVRSGQIKKKKQILEKCKTDIIIYLQDDVILEPYTIAKIITDFRKNPDVTYLSIHNEPVTATSFMEGVVSVGTRIAYKTAKYWNHGDNYLSVVGRCEAFRTNFAKKHFRFIDKVVATDAFFYYENKKHGGKYKFLHDARLYFKNPQTLKEHQRKSSKFQHSKEEMLRYFHPDILDYSIPMIAYLKAFIGEFLASPFKFSLFLLIYVYTRLTKIESKKSLNPIWETDISTKKVIITD